MDKNIIINDIATHSSRINKYFNGNIDEYNPMSRQRYLGLIDNLKDILNNDKKKFFIPCEIEYITTKIIYSTFSLLPDIQRNIQKILNENIQRNIQKKELPIMNGYMQDDIILFKNYKNDNGNNTKYDWFW